MTSTDRVPSQAPDRAPPRVSTGVTRPFHPRTVASPMARLASLLGGGRKGRLRAGTENLTLTTAGLMPLASPRAPHPPEPALSPLAALVALTPFAGAVAAPAPEGAIDGLRMETAAGVLVVSPAQALLRVLTHIDVPETGPLHRLLLDLALQTVPGGWLDLFGAPTLSLSHGDEAAAHGSTWLALSLVLSDGSMRLPLMLHGTPDALLAVLCRPGWSALPPAHPVLPFEGTSLVPLHIGESLVGVRALRALTPGDVLLIEQPTFDRHGRGRLPLGHRVALCELSLGNRLQCRFTNWADGSAAAAHGQASTPSPKNAKNAMDADADVLTTGRPQADARTSPGGTDANANAKSDAHPDVSSGEMASDLDELPVRLSFDLGSLELSLGDVQALTPGTVLPLEGGVPPQVQVRCQGRLVATGELVEVDGRLGVELARLGALA